MPHKSHLLVMVLHVAITIFVSLFVMGVIIGITENNYVIFTSGVVTFLFVWGFLRGYRGKKINVKESVIDPISRKTPTLSSEPEKRPYKFIFTHSENALDAIESTIEAHPKVSSVFQDTGFWYSNGETGPEWFSMHVACKEEDSDEIQNFISEVLEKKGFEHRGINFMGSYN